MTTIYLAGQDNFGNRGCEALVRSTVALLNGHLDRPRILVPSADINSDSAQWPEAAAEGVVFVEAPQMPLRYVNWTRLCRRLPWMTGIPWPALPLSRPLAGYLAESDIVLSIGGDIFSLDYGLDSPFFNAGIADRALEQGKLVILWGASVGPFSAMPAVEKQMASHLRRLSLITVRESHTPEYLASIGVRDNVLGVVDSAFIMEPQAVPIESFWPTGAAGVLGFNVSPIVESARQSTGAATTILQESVAFIRDVLRETNLGVLLVPHVAALDGHVANNDEIYLAQLLCALGDCDGRVRCVPSGLNTRQLKHVISRCEYFIGARTHATIAAFSSGVPTVSIAYSVKARGINRDLFGHERYVLPTPAVSAASLGEMLALIRREAAEIRELLGRRLADYRPRAHAGAAWLAERLGRREESTVSKQVTP
jgi:colanic acid/amylovoran biosynthesis protein